MALKPGAPLPAEVKPLLDAVTAGDETSVARLLQHGEYPVESLSILVEKVLCLKLATRTAVRIADHLVSHGASIVGAAVHVLRNAAPSQAEEGEVGEKVGFVLARLDPVQPAHLFASLHNAPLVARLLARGANPNSPHPSDPSETPLMRALSHEQFVTASLLLRAGADPFVRPKDSTLAYNTIHMALYFGVPATAAILTELARRGVDLNACAPEGGPPLRAAIVVGNHAAVPVLIDLGADATFPGLLEAAVTTHAYDVVRTLVLAGAAPMPQLTAQSLTTMPEHILGMLLRAGATTLPEDEALEAFGCTEKRADMHRRLCLHSHLRPLKIP